jgi:hypothetical protein
MCSPDFGIAEYAAIASALAATGGTIMNANQQASNQANAIRAKNEQTARTIAAEKALQDQSSGIFSQTMKPFQDSAPQQNLQTAQDTNTNAIAANAPTASSLAGGATTGNAPKVVQDSENSTIANRLKSIGQKGTALGALTGYDTNNQALDRGLQDSRLQLGTIGDFAKQTAGVGAAQTEAAIANSQKAPSPFGDLLEGAGQLGSLYAGKNGAFSNLFGSKTPGFVSVTPNQLTGLYG